MTASVQEWTVFPIALAQPIIAVRLLVIQGQLRSPIRANANAFDVSP